MKKRTCTKCVFAKIIALEDSVCYCRLRKCYEDSAKITECPYHRPIED